MRACACVCVYVCDWIWLQVQCYTRVTKMSVMHLGRPKIAHPMLGTFQPQVFHRALTVWHGCQTVRWKASTWSLVANRADISLPPTRQDLTPGQMTRRSIIVRIGKGKVGHEPKLKPCWFMLVIVSLSAIWAW